MVREDLIEGAISFLQDPSVATAPLEQRIAFLRSKNLTQEEIDASLSRAGQAPAPTQYHPPPPYQSTPYHQQPQQTYWPQQPPPDLPRRDWRDWFIAATVAGGVGYALYWSAKRYVLPLIAPPTPAQLAQDKAGVDASFDRAFALLEQLATDTQVLKTSEAARKERLDAALHEVEAVIGRIKSANEERESDAKRLVREIDAIREQVPRAIEKEKESTDARLKELSGEMKSLKTLVANRMAGGSAPSAATRATPSFTATAPAQAGVNGSSASSLPKDATTAPETNGRATPAEEAKAAGGGGAGGASKDGQSSYSRFIGGKAAIPDWQKKKAEGAAAGGEQQGTAESGTVSEGG